LCKYNMQKLYIDTPSSLFLYAHPI
jgi:hypothetical protein